MTSSRQRIPIPAARHWLHRLFVLRQLADQRVDACFDQADAPDDVRVVLFNETDAGLGDAAFMHKAVAVLRGAMPNVELAVVATEPHKHAVFGAREDVHLFDFEAFRARTDAHWKRPDLVLSAPGIFDNCRHRQAVFETLGFADDDHSAGIGFQYIAEYGSLRQLREDAFKPLMPAIDAWVEKQLDAAAKRAGVYDDEVGYRASTGEMVAAFEDRVDSIGSLLTAAAFDADSALGLWLRDPLGKSRSAGIEDGEVGVHVRDSDRAIVALSALSDEATRDAVLEPGGVLYCGYGHGSHGVFLAMVAAIESSSDRRIDVVMPTARSAQRALTDLIDPMPSEGVAAEGVGHIEVIGNAQDEVTLGPRSRVETRLPADKSRASDDGGGTAGKTLRLITRHPLAYEDFRALRHAAHPATMVTGDQSFSDAIAADRAIVCIEPMYCQTWAIDAQVALASQVDAGYGDLLRFSMNARWDDAAWSDFRAALARGEPLAHAASMTARLRDELGLEQPLANLVKRALWCARSAPIQAAIRADLHRGFRGLSVDDGLEFEPSATRAAIAAATQGSAR